MRLAGAVFVFALTRASIIVAQMMESRELEAANSVVAMIEGVQGAVALRGAGIVFAAQEGKVFVATANQVVGSGESRATNLRVRFWQDKAKSYPAEHFADRNEEHDVAVLVVHAPARRFHWAQLGDPSVVRRADRVYAIGYPLGRSWGVTYRPGVVDRVQTLTVYVQSGDIESGHSGGVLIDDAKCVLGMVQASDSFRTRALRSDRLVEILRDLNLPVQLGGCRQAFAAVRPSNSETTMLDRGLARYVYIPPGRFLMGCSADDTECDSGERPTHPVTVSKAFWMCATGHILDTLAWILA